MASGVDTLPSKVAAAKAEKDLPDTYFHARNSLESQRLERQHKLWNQILSYDIHPDLQRTLPISGARIADIGCGTAAWLLSVTKTIPSPHELHGFDISSAQFPPPASLPPNVRLHTLNAMQPFPAEYHGTFDLVHLRLLICALSPADWAKIAENVLQILKPGGYIQWDEADFTHLDIAYRSGPAIATTTTTATISSGPNHSDIERRATPSDFAELPITVLKALGHRFNKHISTLDADLQQTGFAHVQNEVVASDRLIELRAPLCLTIVEAIEAILVTCAEKGVPNVPDAKELARMVQAGKRALEEGIYGRFDIWVWMGQRSQGESC